MVNVPRIRCHSALKHYEMYHWNCGSDNSVFNVTYNFNGGSCFGSSFGGGFWNGIGMGLGAGLMSLFGFGGGSGWGGGFGMPFFGGGWGGGSPAMSTWWGGGASGGNGAGGNTGSTTNTSTTTNTNYYNTVNTPKVDKTYKGYKKRYDKLCNEKKWNKSDKAADSSASKLRQLYSEVLGWNPSDDSDKTTLVDSIERLADLNHVNLDDITKKAKEEKDNAAPAQQADEGGADAQGNTRSNAAGGNGAANNPDVTKAKGQENIEPVDLATVTIPKDDNPEEETLENKLAKITKLEEFIAFIEVNEFDALNPKNEQPLVINKFAVLIQGLSKAELEALKADNNIANCPDLVAKIDEALKKFDNNGQIDDGKGGGQVTKAKPVFGLGYNTFKANYHKASAHTWDGIAWMYTVSEGSSHTTAEIKSKIKALNNIPKTDHVIPKDLYLPDDLFEDGECLLQENITDESKDNEAAIKAHDSEITSYASGEEAVSHAKGVELYQPVVKKDGIAHRTGSIHTSMEQAEIEGNRLKQEEENK